MDIKYNDKVNGLIVALDLNSVPHVSKSGKTMIIESSGGPTTVTVKGIAYKLNINLYRGLTAKEAAEFGSAESTGKQGLSFG